MRTLVVWNVPGDATISDLENLFRQFGDLWDVRFAKNGRYALVTFCSLESAELALSSNDLSLNGRTLLAKMGRWTVLL